MPVGDFQEVRSPLLGEPFVLPHGLDAVEARLTDRFPDKRKSILAFVRQLRRTLDLGEIMSSERGLAWRMTHAAELPLDLWAVMCFSIHEHVVHGFARRRRCLQAAG